MSAVFRHLSVRLWLTALAGGWICMQVLPLWQRPAGMAWGALPVVGVFCAVFAAVGWSMNRLGWMLIRRMAAEAAVWERAGMAAEARAAFEQLSACFDAFWLSPVQRRRRAARVSRQLARFYLAQPKLDAVGRRVVHAYLSLCPDDDILAQEWLATVLQTRHSAPQDQELAARIGDALGRHQTIQRLLVEYYLAERRLDFEAMQTYRRAIGSDAGLPAELTRQLAGLLLDGGHINDWALHIYLTAYAAGDAACREGLAAGIGWLNPNVDNREDLAAARRALPDLSPEQCRQLAVRFQPREGAVARPGALERPRRRAATAAGGVAIKPMIAALRRVVGGRQPGRRMRVLTGNVRQWWRAMPVKYRWGLPAAAVILACTVWALQMWSPGPKPPQVPPAIEPLAREPLPVDDPFTIQVAAYLSRVDAQRFVDHLKQAGAEAFWTEARSANRTWYQVKVSHFATKDAARTYGEALKTRGLIDDFYVANYDQ